MFSRELSAKLFKVLVLHSDLILYSEIFLGIFRTSFFEIFYPADNYRSVCGQATENDKDTVLTGTFGWFAF